MGLQSLGMSATPKTSAGVEVTRRHRPDRPETALTKSYRL